MARKKPQTLVVCDANDIDNDIHKNTEKVTNQSNSKENTTDVCDTMDQWIRDLERIFRKAMDEDKLNIALKAKELLAKSKGWISGGAASTPRTIKAIDQWTLQEINDLIMQLDVYQDESQPPENNTETGKNSEK